MLLKELLNVKSYPCSEAVDWVRENNLTNMYDIYRTCPRGDWLLWWAARINIDHKLLVLAACDCAETALKFVKEGEERPRIAIEIARKWTEGKATKQECRAAADAAAYAAADAADAAADAYAADADADAAYAYAAAADAAAAAAAADAAAYAAADADAAYAYADAAAADAADADADARSKARLRNAQIVRKRIPYQLFKRKVKNENR